MCPKSVRLRSHAPNPPVPSATLSRPIMSTDTRVRSANRLNALKVQKAAGPAVLDDGNGLGPQITYDHVWNVSGVGFGVYSYVIRARKSGSADIVRTGKIGVIK